MACLGIYAETEEKLARGCWSPDLDLKTGLAECKSLLLKHQLRRFGRDKNGGG